ncbi:hypothetical protein F8C76_05990 [Flagellimonas olearia]|uniref:Lipoprotein n=1 Tax=Flagellimonas olearia TaxID=552546 RepID=A0A6I1DZH6_9FLAO|nr:hypothetical protein [Allomuricauda olearia]KAB7531046.1 hypothetical protein F8C76_05990 [Allomuricauda olearia]
MNKKSNLAPKVILLLFVSLCLAIGCSKEEAPNEPPPVGSEPEPEPEPEPAVYFTLTVDNTNTTNTDYEDNWVIVYDSNGNVLDHKPYESGEVLEFTALDSDVTDKITVTLFSYRERTIGYLEGETSLTCEGSLSNLVSYPGISKGSHWVMSRYPSRLPSSSTPNNLGEFTLTVENIPRSGSVPEEYPILNNFNMNLEGNNFGNLSTLRFPEFGSGGTITHSTEYTKMVENGIRNLENTSYLMSILHAEEGLKYLFFQNPDQGSDLTIDYGNFQAFDSYAYFPVVPENERYTLQMVGYENETSFKTHTGYFCLEVNDVNNGMQIPLGFLDRFTHYKTFFNINFGDHRYHYRILGPKPNITSFPEKPSLAFTQNGINGFDFSTNANYIRRTDYFAGQEPISAENCHATYWKIECTQENYPQLSALPDELYTQYPNLVPFDQIKYGSSTIYLQDKEYDEFLRDQFDPTYDHILKYGDITEYFTITRE